jgi:hypothetical protein
MRKYPETLHQLYDFCISYRHIAQISRHPVKSDERYQPFFIIGSGRSGNTLLRRLLNNHSALTIPPETYVLGKVIKRFRQNSGMRWADLVEYIFSAFEFHPEFKTFGFSLRTLVNELKNSPINNRNLAYILNRFYHYYCRQSGNSCVRWGDKTPMNTFCLERIISVFPDARFIHILRDGCDVVSSYIDAGIYKSFEEAALRWGDSIELVENFYKHHPAAGTIVRYEELVSDPENTLTNICAFLGVDFEENMLQETTDVNRIRMGDVEIHAHHANVLKPVNMDSIGKGRARLSADQKAVIDKIIGLHLKRLGYERCTS